MAASTSPAVTLRDASRTGSSQTRMANWRPPRIWASPTPSTVVKRGCTTCVRNSVTCCGFISVERTAIYISANSKPVPFTTTGSSASAGNCPRTCCTLASTSISAWSGSALSCMLTETVLDPSVLEEVT
jgi:hypothetical protein